MEELRRFYSAQAIKHKEDMEQAVNHKVSGLQQTSRECIAVTDVIKVIYLRRPVEIGRHFSLFQIVLNEHGVLDDTGLKIYPVLFSLWHFLQYRADAVKLSKLCCTASSTA